MIFRGADHADIDACKPFEWTRNADDLHWHVDARLIYVAADDRIVAYARLESFWKAMPYLALIEVDKDRRGNDIGSKLLQHVCDDLRVRGFATLLSSTTGGEDRPRRWHLRNGFVDVGTLSGLNAAGVDEIFYRRAL